MGKKGAKRVITTLLSGLLTIPVYAYGPGQDNLSDSDELAQYQWGLRNESSIQYLEIQNIFQDTDEQLATIMDSANLAGIPLPEELAGPAFYELVTTDAIYGLDINIKKAWELYDQSEELHREVIVAILDTGVDYRHKELEHAMWMNEDEIPDDGIDNDGNGYIDDGYGWNFFDDNNVIYTGIDDIHGTHVAGTISAGRGDGGIAGITDNQYVKLMPLGVLGTEDGLGAEDAIIRAIQYAEANGASICNLSLGTDEYYPNLEQVMRDSNMLFIVAVGNGGDDMEGDHIGTTLDYPAMFDVPNMITVANLLFDGNLEGSSNFSSDYVDIAAPGTYILSIAPNNQYLYMTGTSMAAPFVTGVAAMVYSFGTELDLSQVKDLILNSVRKLDTLEGKIKTGGVLDAYAALQRSVLSQ